MEITWQDVPADAGTQEVATSVVTVTMTNVSPFALSFSEVRAMGDASGIPFTVAQLHEPFSLAPGASQALAVDLDEYVDLSDMPSAGAIEIFAQVNAQDGPLLEHAASETLFFNAAGDGLELYNADGLRAAKNAGDLADQASELILPGTRRVIVFPASAQAAEEGA